MWYKNYLIYDIKKPMQSLVPLTIQEQLALRVRTKRRVLRLSQSELAQKIGTSQTAIARLESGQGNPTTDLIQRVANALDLQLTIHVRPQPAPNNEPGWLKQV